MRRSLARTARRVPSFCASKQRLYSRLCACAALDHFRDERWRSALHGDPQYRAGSKVAPLWASRGLMDLIVRNTQTRQTAGQSYGEIVALSMPPMARSCAPRSFIQGICTAST